MIEHGDDEQKRKIKREEKPEIAEAAVCIKATSVDGLVSSFRVTDRSSFACTLSPIMKTIAIVVVFALIATSLAFPQQKDGQIFSREAIKQAQQTSLIPKDAYIQNVQEGIEVAAYESIPGNQRINLFEILGVHVPAEVVNNLQGQIDQIGKN